MTKFCVGDILVEELRERNLNINDLLQECTKTKKQKIEIVRQVVEDEKFIITHFDNKIEIVRKRK